MGEVRMKEIGETGVKIGQERSAETVLSPEEIHSQAESIRALVKSRLSILQTWRAAASSLAEITPYTNQRYLWMTRRNLFPLRPLIPNEVVYPGSPDLFKFVTDDEEKQDRLFLTLNTGDLVFPGGYNAKMRTIWALLSDAEIVEKASNTPAAIDAYQAWLNSVLAPTR